MDVGNVSHLPDLCVQSTSNDGDRRSAKSRCKICMDGLVPALLFGVRRSVIQVPGTRNCSTPPQASLGDHSHKHDITYICLLQFFRLFRFFVGKPTSILS